MGWLGAVLLIAALLVTAIAAGAGGFWASGVARRKTSGSRGPFVVGVVCGLVAGVAVTSGRRGLTTLGSSTLKAVFRPLRAGIGAPVDDLLKRCLATVKVKI